MALPMQTAPNYTVRLPSNNEEVTFRPFLVKEQKYLLLMKEGENSKDTFSAIKQLIKSVTSESVDVEKLPMYDIEYLFLQIRAKSVGETVNFNMTCRNTECDATTQIDVDLETVEVVKKEVNDNIKLTEELGVILRYPSVNQIIDADSITDPEEKTMKLLESSIKSIYDSENSYEADETPSSELRDFIENLTLTQLEDMNEFFESVPSVQKNIEWNCSSCGTENSYIFKGLNNFF